MKEKYKHLLPLVHKECGKVAMMYSEKYNFWRHSQIQEGLLFYMNGDIMQNGAKIACEYCNEGLDIDIDSNGTLYAVNTRYKR